MQMLATSSASNRSASVAPISGGRRLIVFRRATLGFLTVYLLILLVTMVVRSVDKKASGVFQTTTTPAPSGENSKLHLQEFYQVRLKGGRESYEIKARDAKYYSQEGVTYVLNVELTLPRRDGTELKIFADSARLFLEGETLDRAELQGNVVLKQGESMTLKTDFATYDSTEQLVTAPRQVRVEGTGYAIDGVGMDLALDTEIVTLHRDVKSRFDKGTQMPEILPRK